MSLYKWHHQSNGHELRQTPGDGEEQGGVACHSPWGCKDLDMTEVTGAPGACLIAQLVKNLPAMQEVLI